MKKIIISLALVVGLSVVGNAFTRAIEEPITHVSDIADSTVSVSSAPWTELISSALIKRDGMFINNPKINTGSLYIHLSTTTNTPAISTNTAVIELEPGEFIRVKLSEDIAVFGITTHTGAETMYIQEFRQTK